LQKSVGSWCLVTLGTLLASCAPARAHHSLAAFDIVGSLELSGTVQEFKFTNPHSYIVMKAKGPDGHVTTWTLEGVAASGLERDGWNRATLKPGDQIKATIQPLLSGGAGGSWNPWNIHFQDGRTVAR